MVASPDPLGAPSAPHGDERGEAPTLSDSQPRAARLSPISPDGRWWWDGQAWLPVTAGGAAGLPTQTDVPTPTPQFRHEVRSPRRRLLLALLAVVVVVGAIVASGLVILRVSREFTEGIFHVAWAPDGQRLAYTTDAGLWTVPADGSQAPRRLLAEPSVQEMEWAPDGQSIALAIGPQPHVSLWVVDVASGNTRELADLYPYCPKYAWAPDSGTLAVVGPHGDVSTVEAATGRSRALISMAGSAGLIVGPVWSGDASAVFLAGARREGGEGIWTITVANSEQHLVWSAPVADLWYQLAVEPGGGDLVAFQNCADTSVGDPNQPSQDECTWYVVQQNGSGLQRLDEAPQWAAADVGLPQPWLNSPDGRYAAQVKGLGPASELWVDAVDGSSHVLVAER